MTRMIVHNALLLAALVAAWQPSKAQANPEDTQFWLIGFVRGDIGDDIFLTIDTSYRWRDPVFGEDQQTVRVTVEKGVNEEVRLGGGLSFFQAGSISEIRPHQQFRYSKGGLELRTRFEQRWFDGADQVELRIRQRIQFTQPVSEQMKAIGSVEWFGIVQPRRDSGNTGTEQLRGTIGVSFEVSNDLEIAPSYLIQLTPRENNPDAISHIPQITLNYRF